jgi:molecular chaperone DnaJ
VARRGADLRYDLEVTLAEAYRGTEEITEVRVRAVCESCSGSGATAGSKPQNCSACGGNGQVVEVRGSGFFQMRTVRTCPRCGGEGQTISDPCSQCQGDGRVRKTKRLSVKVPAGIDDGARIRLQGQGDDGEHGGPSGDLYVFVHLKPHDLFRRHGLDVFCEIPVSFTQAALGDAFEVPTLGGKARLDLPAGTQAGEEIVLKGQGFPALQGLRRGDQVCVIRVLTPTSLNKRQKELLREFAQAGGGKLPEEHQSFWERIVDTLTGKSDD